MKIANELTISLLIIVAGILSWATNSFVLVGLVLTALVTAALLYALWNSTVSVIVGLRYITYWEALRLLLLCWLIIGSALWSCKLVLGTSIFSR